jgi:D-alanyl-D-alanine carboxypeptidase/D-alanyl-D-alanine-endopeptidase (penicillin-binding protein 4)
VAGRHGVVWWVSAAVGLAMLASAGGLALTRPWSDADVPDLPPPPSPVPEPIAVLAAVPDAPAPTPDGVRAAIDGLVREADQTGQVTAAVVDAVTGERLYQYDPDTPAVPASTLKLVTAATALAELGPAHQLATVAVAGDEPGEVVLVGGGDPTLAVDDTGFYPDAARLDVLAEQVRTAMRGTEINTVTVDSTLFTGPVYGPWDGDIPTGGFVGPITALMTDGGRVDPDRDQRAAQRWDEPDLAAGRQFAELLGLDEDDVSASSAPPDAAELGRVLSPPIQRLVEIMLAASDNVIAEALSRQVALARGEPASYEGAGAAMADALRDELGLDDAALADGSGLSRESRLTAGLLTELLAASVGPQAPRLGGLVTGLAVAGWSGTLADRYEAAEYEPGVGVVRAKTGTLAGVHSLAGLVVTADGRLLAFALMGNETPEGTHDHLDRIAAALASCGCS